MTKLSKARERGLWPEPGPIGYGDRPRVAVEIAMEQADYDWLAGFVHTTGHIWYVEDALNKAVSGMRGKEPLAYFAEGIAGQHNVPASELLFRPRGEAEAEATHSLYMAALFVAELSRTHMLCFVRDDNLPPPEVLALAQAALGNDRDLRAEIESARKELADIEAKDAAESVEVRDRAEKPPGGSDLDDDIPF